MVPFHAMSNTYGPTFRWFAWHPTNTRDRGWRWLRFVSKRKIYIDISAQPAMARFETYVEKP